MKLERLGMVINPKDVEDIDKIARKEEVSRSFLIRKAIKEFVKKENDSTTE